MSTFSFRPASEFSIARLADLLTRGFEGYFVPIHITEPVLLSMMRRDSLDLTESRVLFRDEEPIGLALIGRRGWTSRLAAMGIVSAARNCGAGTWAMRSLIEEARARGDRQMFLEVIEQNMAGVKLYQKSGFKIMRRLVGYKLEYPIVESTEELQEVGIDEIARQVIQHGLTDLPWQLSGVTLSQHTPPARAFRLRDAYCLISNPEAEHVAISSVLENVSSGETGSSLSLMRAVFSRFSNKVWHVSAVYPEEMSPIFEQAGMKREEISQWQMSLAL